MLGSAFTTTPPGQGTPDAASVAMENPVMPGNNNLVTQDSPNQISTYCLRDASPPVGAEANGNDNTGLSLPTRSLCRRAQVWLSQPTDRSKIVDWP